MTKVTLWIPAAESPRWPCVMSWLHMDDADCQLSFVKSGANNIKFSWNKVVKDFLATDGDWLFSSHNDVQFDPGTLPRLLSWGKPLVSALIFMRTSPVLPHIWASYEDHQHPYIMRINDTYNFFRQHNEYASKFGPFIMDPRPDDALTEIDFTSTSCCIIHRSVLEKMRVIIGEEWFRWDNDYNGGGEDRHFFEVARAAGFPAFVDRSCVAGHLVGDIATGVMDFITWQNTNKFEGTGEPELDKEI
jgi:hypothetical protein